MESLTKLEQLDAENSRLRWRLAATEVALADALARAEGAEASGDEARRELEKLRPIADAAAALAQLEREDARLLGYTSHPLFQGAVRGSRRVGVVMPQRYTHSMTLPLRLSSRAVQSVLSYTSADPHAVTLLIDDRGQSREWLLDRALLRDGRWWLTGCGDVQVKPGRNETKVDIRLCAAPGTSAQDGDVTLEASMVLITVFVARIYAAVPEGREHEWLEASLNAELAELLGEGERT